MVWIIDESSLICMEKKKRNLRIYDIGSAYILVKGGTWLYLKNLIWMIQLSDENIIHVWINLN